MRNIIDELDRERKKKLYARFTKIVGDSSARGSQFHVKKGAFNLLFGSMLNEPVKGLELIRGKGRVALA